MPHIRAWSSVEDALRDSDSGMPDSENAAKHGVAIKTIRRWRRDYQRRGLPRGQLHVDTACPRCDGAALASAEYSELLGWYLGDGHISRGRRDVYALHVFNDQRYVDDNARLISLMSAVKPGGRPHTRRAPGAIVTTVSWKHWPCLFPQHGPGRKHERAIVLEDWQRVIVEAHPGPFLRGLFHSDGSRVKNWARRPVAGELKRYEYPRWQFSNVSTDIQQLCCWALDLVGIAWRQSSAKHISVSRRAAVARLDELIGVKS
ncbi:hypothetical protein BH09ACT12_BH09ACT12_03020 [soil metagenome]